MLLVGQVIFCLAVCCKEQHKKAERSVAKFGKGVYCRFHESKGQFYKVDKQKTMCLRNASNFSQSALIQRTEGKNGTPVFIKSDHLYPIGC